MEGDTGEAPHCKWEGKKEVGMSRAKPKEVFLLLEMDLFSTISTWRRRKEPLLLPVLPQ